MRLIDTESLQFREFVEGSVPAYACLSHRWTTEEVTFQQWSEENAHNSELAGYRKVVSACRTALARNILWLWIDTVCIDKKSSSELSEAINSMFTWYQECQICLVHLADVDGDGNCDENGNLLHLPYSEWLSRAWTLQELLAPRNVLFYDRDWQFLGTKLDLVSDIHTHTKIHLRVITNFTHSEWSVAQRMSWASSRKATRTEDIAYSLLGVFDINMPMLYGEGKKAFTRLQTEIIRTTTDTSILAWVALPGASLDVQRSLLAESPAFFRNCHNRTGLFSQLQDIPDLAHLSVVATGTITNLGLETTLPLTPLKSARRNALVAFELAGPGSTPKDRKGCFLWLDHIHGDHYVQRSAHGMNVKVLSTSHPDAVSSTFEWRKITIASKPFKRVGLAQDRFLLKKYMSHTGPLQNIFPKTKQADYGEGGVIRALGTTPCETVGVWFSADRENVSASYIVKFGFDAGHSPMFLFKHSNKNAESISSRVESGDKTLFAVDWMQLELDMVQHDSKAFSWVEHNDNGEEGIILHMYSRRGFKIQWKTISLELEASGEDETGLEWSLGIRNSLAPDETMPSSSSLATDIEHTLRSSGEELMSFARSMFQISRLRGR